MNDRVTVVANALPYFRTVRRGEQDVVQQRFLIIRSAGTTKESSFHVWLDIEHAMFTVVESPGEAAARKNIEQLYAENGLSISYR